MKNLIGSNFRNLTKKIKRFVFFFYIKYNIYVKYGGNLGRVCEI